MDVDKVGIPVRESYQNDIWHTSVQIDVRTLRQSRRELGLARGDLESKNVETMLDLLI